MTVFYRHNRQAWCYAFELGGKRHYGYAKHPDSGEMAATRREAKKIEDLVRAHALLSLDAPAPKASAYSVGQAFSAFATRKMNGGNWANQKVYVRELVAYFEAATPVAEIDEQCVWDYIAWARAKPLTVYTGAGKPIDAALAAPEASALRTRMAGTSPSQESQPREFARFQGVADPLDNLLFSLGTSMVGAAGFEPTTSSPPD